MSLELNPQLEIKPSPIQGLGIFALDQFEPGDRIRVVLDDVPTVLMSDQEFLDYIRTVQSWDAVYLGDGMHRVSLVSRDENPGNYGNHSCDPNSALDGEVRVVTRHIDPGDELTIDYSTHSPKGWSMVCHCGATNCAGLVRGVL